MGVLVFLLIVAVIALFVWLGRLRAQINELRTQLYAESDRRADQNQALQSQIAALRHVPTHVPTHDPEPEPESEPAVPPPLPPPLPVTSFVPFSAGTSVEPETPQPATDWEGIIGGNWANKAGVVVLIIGLALFLQYSLTHLGPGGRVALGCMLSASLLVTGVLLEKHVSWRNYARGLIGGGWAGLYFTTYAAHAISAARIIESPGLAATLLLTVSVGMILHSLRYRSETVTGLSYFITFGTLAVSPLSAFAVVAVLPLAASLLWIACRFQWTVTVVAGQAFTFLLYLIHIGEVGFRPDRLMWGELALAAYWILFEIYDIGFAGRRPGVLRSLMIALNAIGFLGLSLYQWQQSRPLTLWVPLFLATALYAASCTARARLNPPSSFEGIGFEKRATAGSYEGAAAIACGLSIAGVFNAFHGFWINAALLVQAEFLLWLSVRYRQEFPRHLSSITFAFPVAKLVLNDIPYATNTWSPMALATAAVALANRVWRRRLITYSFIAVVLAATVLSFEVPAEWVPLAWLFLGAVLFEVSDGGGRRDWLGVAISVGIVASVALFFNNVFDFGLQGPSPWVPQLACAMLTGATAFLAYVHHEKFGAAWVRDLGAGLCAISLAAFAHTLLPDYVVVVAWAAISLTLLETGLRLRAVIIRAEAHVLLIVACGWLFTFDVFDNRVQFWFLSRGFLVCAPFIALLYYSRARYGIAPWERWLTRAYSFFGVLAAILVVHTDFDRAVAVIASASMGFVLLIYAKRNGESDFFTQAYLISTLAFGRALWECAQQHQAFGVDTALLAGVPTALFFYAAEFLLPRGAADLRAPRTWYSVAASTLVAAILWTEVRGGLLTVSWALEAVALLVAGFPLRERVLRLSALFLLCVCVLKVFFYDLSTLSRPFQILSFVALGVLLLGASAFYTRYRDRFREYFL